MIERLIYEGRPFLYLGGAMTAHTVNPNALTNTFAFLLGACVACVLYWRYQNRYQSSRPATHKQRR